MYKSLFCLAAILICGRHFEHWSWPGQFLKATWFGHHMCQISCRCLLWDDFWVICPTIMYRSLLSLAAILNYGRHFQIWSWPGHFLRQRDVDIICHKFHACIIFERFHRHVPLNCKNHYLARWPSWILDGILQIGRDQDIFLKQCTLDIVCVTFPDLIYFKTFSQTSVPPYTIMYKSLHSLEAILNFRRHFEHCCGQ